MNSLLRGIAGLVVLGLKIVRRGCMFAVKPMNKRCGRNVIFHPFDGFTHSTILIGNHVFIGNALCFSPSESAITIGNKVTFSSCVTIMGGDHNTSEVGRFIIDVRGKRACDDLPAVIEDDVWIGARAIILKGVTIGRGSIVAAGSVVTRSKPEFSVSAGVPACVIKPRFSNEQLEKHKLLLSSKGK